MSVRVLILADAGAHFALGGRSLLDWAIASASLLGEKAPLVLGDESDWQQARTELAGAKAERVIVLQASRVVFSSERLASLASLSGVGADGALDAGGRLVSLLKSEGGGLAAAALDDDTMAAVMDAWQTHKLSLDAVMAVVEQRGARCGEQACGRGEAFLVDAPERLAQVEAFLQAVLRRRALRAGVFLDAPESVHFSFDTEVEAGARVEPFVVFAPGVRVRRGARIRAFSHLEECEIGEDAIVGPYARVRPGSRIGAMARVGNFVEVKQANIGMGAKVSHLAYVGDAEVGEGANVGAGVVTCNYDGIAKHATSIGAAAFVGSNASLVAPVRIGAGAYVGAGSVITEDVEAESLALGRARQSAHPGWARRKNKKKKEA